MPASTVNGDRRALECLAGCGLYIVNQTMGQTIRSLVGPLYVMFENCIQKGVRTADTCTITGCVLDLIDNDLKLAKSIGMPIPYQDSVEQFIGCMKLKHTVEPTAHTKTSPSTKLLLQPEPNEEERPSDTSAAATTTVLHICGYLLVSLLTSYI
jgi:hypothetical protein